MTSKTKITGRKKRLGGDSLQVPVQWEGLNMPTLHSRAELRVEDSTGGPPQSVVPAGHTVRNGAGREGGSVTGDGGNSHVG